MRNKIENSHWSDYWDTGVITSLPQDFRSNYDGELLTFWQAVIEKLPTVSAVVDVCTGNLALPLLISEINQSTKKKLAIKAVDLAQIDKQKIINRHPNLSHWLDKIQVFDETAIESLDDVITSPVDLITSQYGLEYCDIENIAPKLTSLLKTDGRLVFVAHASDTAILAAMKEEKEAFDWLQSQAIFYILKSYGEGRFKPDYFLKQINKTLPEIHQELVRAPKQLLKIFHQALGGLSQLSKEQLSTQREAVAQFYLQHWQAQLRAADLLAVSEKIAKNPEWYLPFENAGLVLEHKQSILYQGKHNAGTAYQFRKSDKK